MSSALDRNQFFVKESTGLLKAACSYDILDPESGELILKCRESDLGFLAKLLRFSDLRRSTPFNFLVTTAGDEPVMRVARGVPLIVSKVQVFDADGDPIGGFVLKPFSISGAFDVLDANGVPVCKLKGGLTGRNFCFLSPDNLELAVVSRKWAGVGKELFSSASDYMLSIDEAVPHGGATRQLIVASVLCIGMVLKIDT
jgi:uncharacterized protein YxjI